MGRRYSRSVDKNQPEIVAGLTERGFTVIDQAGVKGAGYDLIVIRGEVVRFVEVKNPEGHRMRMTGAEERMQRLLGPVLYVVAVSVEDVVKAFG